MFSKPLFLSPTSGTTAFTIDQSIRFNDDDSAYMYRTPSSASNRDKWTWSGWIKRGNISANLQMFSAPLGSSAGYMSIQYDSSDSFMLYQWTGSGYDFDVRTTQVFRDLSAWYHYVVVYDSGNAISTERVKLYVNGQRITNLTGASSVVYPSQNTDSYINNTVQHSIGYYIRPPSAGGQYFDGYMTEINFIDGLALDPSYFGETTSNGLWIPKAYDGSYGTNGFRIDGRDASDLGDDESGNGNDFTTSGLATHDQFLDSPTNNFCTINPLANRLITYKNGNMESNATSQTTAHKTVKSTLGIPPSATGKYYFEWQVPSSTSSGDVDMIGFCDLEDGTNTESSTVNSGRGYGIGYKIGTGNVYAGTGWTANSFTFGGFVASNYYGFAYDASTGKLYIYQNGSALNSGAHVATFDKSSTIAPGYSQYYNTSTYKFFNGAQTSLTNSNFNYAPPTGYVPINTANIGDEF
tara:strand:+ start:611 stop:2008 length:1398 start_codon:yes stop_codon:yes gene_type:complete